jgi:amino acid permease
MSLVTHERKNTSGGYGSIPNNDDGAESDDVYLVDCDDDDGNDNDPQTVEEGGEGSKLFHRMSTAMLSFHTDRPVGSDLLYNARQSIRNTITTLLPQPTGPHFSVRDVQGNATIPVEIVNLVKNIVGSGALALPSGIAAFANNPSGLLGGAVWILIMGTIFAYFFLLIGRTCKITQTATYAEAWERTMGVKGSGLVALSVALKAGIGNLECSMILADSFRDLINGSLGLGISRAIALLIVTLVALLPLCMLKNLAVLAPFSGLGLLAMIFTAVAITIRYLDGSYNEGGQFYNDLIDEHKPTFGSTGLKGAIQLPVLFFLCMVSEAFTAHYNAPRFWMELKKRTVVRYAKVVVSSFSISALYYVFVTSFGFLTFGGASAGMILNNYSTHDILASSSRACVGFSLIFGYPLIFVGFRDAMLDVCMIPAELQTSANLNIITIALLTVITILAIFLEDLGAVVAFGGGGLSTIVVFIIPTIMFNKSIELLGYKASSLHKKETIITTILMWIGIFIGVVGVKLALTK